MLHKAYYKVAASLPSITSRLCLADLADLAEMGCRCYPNGDVLQDSDSSGTTGETYQTDDEVDADRGYATDLTDSDVNEIEGRSGRKHEVEDSGEDSDEDTDGDVSSCSDGDNYKANTKVLIDRIEGRW